MPELPEVEVFTRYFVENAPGRAIRGVEVRAPRILDGITPRDLHRLLQGKSFLSGRRYGKNLLADISGGRILVFHFGMTGYLKFFDDLSADTPYDRMLITFENGFLAYDNRRMIGRIGHAESLEEFIRRKGLGPDFCSLDEEGFAEALSGAKGGLKVALMDQGRVAGIGNEYSDEILFQARLHPLHPVQSLTREALGSLYRICAGVLATAVEKNAEQENYPGHFFLRTRRSSRRCPRCGDTIRSLKAGGRSAYFCPACQPAP